MLRCSEILPTWDAEICSLYDTRNLTQSSLIHLITDGFSSDKGGRYTYTMTATFSNIRIRKGKIAMLFLLAILIFLQQQAIRDVCFSYPKCCGVKHLLPKQRVSTSCVPYYLVISRTLARKS